MHFGFFSAFFLRNEEIFSSLQRPQQLAPLLSTCINREGQSWAFKQQKETLKWQKLVFPACHPEYKTPEEHEAARGMPPWQHRSPSSPLTGAEEETRARSCFPNDDYFLYYGNNYSHPADKLLSQADRLGRPWLLWDGKNVYPLHSPFSCVATLLEWAGFGAQASSNASKTGSACCKQT